MLAQKKTFTANISNRKRQLFFYANFLCLTPNNTLSEQPSKNDSFSIAITSKDSNKPGFATLIAEYSLGKESGIDSLQIIKALKKLRFFIKTINTSLLNSVDLAYIDKNLPKPPSSLKDRYLDLEFNIEFYCFWQDLSASKLKDIILQKHNNSSPNISFTEQYKNAAQAAVLNSLKELINQEKKSMDLLKTISLCNELTYPPTAHKSLLRNISQQIIQWLSNLSLDEELKNSLVSWKATKLIKNPVWFSVFEKIENLLEQHP